jgi:hypothetical protein
LSALTIKVKSTRPRESTGVHMKKAKLPFQPSFVFNFGLLCSGDFISKEIMEALWWWRILLIGHQTNWKNFLKIDLTFAAGSPTGWPDWTNFRLLREFTWIAKMYFYLFRGKISI